mmetsp:Transcript_10409/g.30443  ORF Transcript_10409/g.30443 Transcript_10409/m.30443 type:complete len:198 (-) Transcript_10409:335-928(-)
MKTMFRIALSIVAIVAVAKCGMIETDAFAPTSRLLPFHSNHVLSMGIIDDLKLIFSAEGKKNKAAYEARERAEQQAALNEILERRRNPDKMQDYQQKVASNRAKLQEEKDVWGFQGKVQDGYDPLTDWKRLKDEGKITVGSEMERDPTSRRLGSEGLVDVRTDELLPYIDQGYVDESADVMGGLKKLFGGKKDNGKN